MWGPEDSGSTVERAFTFFLGGWLLISRRASSYMGKNRLVFPRLFTSAFDFVVVVIATPDRNLSSAHRSNHETSKSKKEYPGNSWKFLGQRSRIWLDYEGGKDRDGVIKHHVKDFM